MKTLKPTAIAALLLVGLVGSLGGAAHARTVVQTAAFDDTFTGFTGAASETHALYPSPLSATFSPFDASLGTLIDTTITWQAGFSFSGMSAPYDAQLVSNGGSLTGGIGGQFEVNKTPYGGDGTGGGNGAAPEVPFSVDFSIGPDSMTFVSSEAGMAYDPAILAAFEGTSPFTAAYVLDDDISNYTARNIASGSAAFSSSVTLTYDYATSPTPEPTTWALLLVGFAGVGATVRGRRRADVAI